MVALPCPHCQQTEAVKRHSATRAGTKRFYCKDCKRAFSLDPQPKTLSPEKEALILRLLEERTTIRGICRAAQCSPNTVYAVLKKSGEPASV